jgi:hypothetical protein
MGTIAVLFSIIYVRAGYEPTLADFGFSRLTDFPCLLNRPKINKNIDGIYGNGYILIAVR